MALLSGGWYRRNILARKERGGQLQMSTLRNPGFIFPDGITGQASTFDYPRVDLNPGPTKEKPLSLSWVVKKWNPAGGCLSFSGLTTFGKTPP